MKEKIGEFFTDLAEKRGFTKYQISKETGINDGTLSAIFSGKREPGAINFIKICQFLKPAPKDLSEFIKNF